jgi:dipeptidyl aminopeptidase/acylaminoacyl peptidase
VSVGYARHPIRRDGNPCASAFLYFKRPWQQPEPKKQLVQRQLTANPSDNPVVVAVISPDGKQLAYADARNGLSLLQIDSGERRTFPNSLSVYPASWYPDGTHLLVVSGSPVNALQKMSTLDGTTRKLMDADITYSAALSRDGTQILFMKSAARSELWLMRAEGGDAHRMNSVAPDSIAAFEWSPSSRRVAYLRYGHQEMALESCGTDGGHVVRIHADDRFQGINGFGDIFWLRNGSLFYRLSEPPPNTTVLLNWHAFENNVWH